MEALFKYIDRLRREPEEKRRRSAFWFSLALTLLILMSWLLGQEVARLFSRESADFWFKQWLRIKQGWQVIVK